MYSRRGLAPQETSVCAVVACLLPFSHFFVSVYGVSIYGRSLYVVPRDVRVSGLYCRVLLEQPT